MSVQDGIEFSANRCDLEIGKAHFGALNIADTQPVLITNTSNNLEPVTSESVCLGIPRYSFLNIEKWIILATHANRLL